ncbi:MEKHLA domain-containing protein [Myxosarcina sp. GI1(2024)]
MSLPIWHQPEIITRSQILVNSFEKAIGRKLISSVDSPETLSKTLFFAPFALVSHDDSSDPILTYGNQVALELWEMSWEKFIQTPSRLTAEMENRETRKMMLDRVVRQGYIDNYRGVRISSSGNRFLIERAIVWNLNNERGDYCGQAATFSNWSFLKT